MIREDRELLVELESVTQHVVRFITTILGAQPVSRDLQQELGIHLMSVGRTLCQNATFGQPINGYVNGTVEPHPTIEAPPESG